MGNSPYLIVPLDTPAAPPPQYAPAFTLLHPPVVPLIYQLPKVRPCSNPHPPGAPPDIITPLEVCPCFTLPHGAPLLYPPWCTPALGHSDCWRIVRFMPRLSPRPPGHSTCKIQTNPANTCEKYLQCGRCCQIESKGSITYFLVAEGPQSFSSRKPKRILLSPTTASVIFFCITVKLYKYCKI